MRGGKGNDFRWNSGDRGHPGNEAALERLGVGYRENFGKAVMRGSSNPERQEAAERGELLFAEKGYIRKGLRPSQHRQQARKQYFVQRVDHPALLAETPRILEILKKSNTVA